MANIANWKDPPFFMGKSTISTGPFSIAMLNYQRVNPGWLFETLDVAAVCSCSIRSFQQFAMENLPGE